MLYRWLLFVAPGLFSAALQAQTSVLTCATSAVPTTIRAEGIAERTGDILVSCAGQPGAQATGNIIVTLSVNVTNRILSDGTTDVFLTVDNGSGVVTYIARPYSINAITFNGVQFTASSQGKVDLRIINLRGNASQLGFSNNNNAIAATFSFTGGSFSIPNSQLIVATPQRALLSSTNGQLVCDQNGSPLPDVLNYANLLGTSAFMTTRVTEGFASAFVPSSDPSNLRADTGIRIMVRYSGFTGGARLFVPDAIAGSDADIPTGTGTFGFAASSGQYTPARGELLLIRVGGADANGAGGSLAIPVPTAQGSFNSVGEIPLNAGAGNAVYEVVDSNPFLRETAQFPTFLGLAPNSGASGTPTSSSVSLAPVSTVVTQSSTAPIPRFVETRPPADCSLLGDCNASYMPRLQLDTTPIQVSAASGQPVTTYVPVRNNGAGVLQWNVTVTYGAGGATGNWLRVSPAQGANNSTIRIDAITTGLPAGTYTATLSIDAGPLAGVQNIPITLTVTGATPPTVVAPSITGITNAAGTDQTTLVAGSLATIYGAHLSGATVQVTFDGTPATVIYSSVQQINVQVPAAVTGKQKASVVVSVDGNVSSAMTINLATAAPAIFSGAVLNQDWGVNGASVPAHVGSVVQVYATGLPSAGVITAKIHDRVIAVPQYAGAAPGFQGVQQVNIQVPADLPTMQTYVFVCGGPSADQQNCSAPAKVWITQ